MRGMNYLIDDVHAILKSENVWIPSEDSRNKRLIAYTLWLGNTIRAYCAGQGNEWTAWVFYPDVDFEKDAFMCYQYTCKKVCASNNFSSKKDAMAWAETFTRLVD